MAGAFFLSGGDLVAPGVGGWGNNPRVAWGCAFGHVCERYLLTGDEIHIVKELTELVAQRVSAASFKGAVEKDYKASNDRLKDIWKARHEEHGDHEVLCGDVLVKIKKARNGSIRPTYKPKGK